MTLPRADVRTASVDKPVHTQGILRVWTCGVDAASTQLPESARNSLRVDVWTVWTP